MDEFLAVLLKIFFAGICSAIVLYALLDVFHRFVLWLMDTGDD